MSIWRRLRTHVGVSAGVASILGLVLVGQFLVAVPQAFAMMTDAEVNAPVSAPDLPASTHVMGVMNSSSALGSAVPYSVGQWKSSIISYSNAYGVDPNLVAAIIRTESVGDPNAANPSGAVGLMQVVGGSYDPNANIQEGVSLLAHYLVEFHGNAELAVAAYNAGDTTVRYYGGIPPYPETENYVYNVMNRYYLYSGS